MRNTFPTRLARSCKQTNWLRLLAALAFVLAISATSGICQNHPGQLHPASLASVVGAVFDNSIPAPTQITAQSAAATHAVLPAVIAQAEAPTEQPPLSPEDEGDLLMTQQHYQAAIAAYRRVARPSADLWNKMGIAYQQMFNLVDASHCYQASLHLDARNPRVLNNLATIYDTQKEFGDAERLYHKALRISPKSPLILKNLGTNLLAQHKYKKGWEAYQSALAIDPYVFLKTTSSPRVQNPTSLEDRGAMNYYMAKGCVRAGMNDCAIDYLRMALNEGFISPKKIEADSEFAGLRSVAAFQQLMAEQCQQ